MEGLRASWGQLVAAINRALNETQNQILIRDSKGLTEEQLSEYRKSFNHFDKVFEQGEGCGVCGVCRLYDEGRSSPIC